MRYRRHAAGRRAASAAALSCALLAAAGAAGQGSGAGQNAATFTPFATPTRTQTFTATPSLTPLPTAEPDCEWTTFRLGSDDDASWMRIDAAGGAWPPAGGSGPSDVTADGRVRVMVQGSSDTGAALAVWGEIPPAVAWPARMERQAAGAWSVDNLATNNQSSIDLRGIRLPMAPPGYTIPWVETWPHPPCGGSGLASDLAACDPDVVILVPEANDAMWPLLYPGQVVVPPEALAEALIGQCDTVLADNPQRACVVATVSKAPYVATWPAASDWIDRANAHIRALVPRARVLDFTTASSDALDYRHVPFGYETLISHSNQRLHDVRAARAFAGLARSAFTTEAAVLQAEARRWNGVSGSSLFALRWDTSALPDDGEVRRAVVELRATFRGAVGEAAETRSLALQWANDAAADGWQADDWPAELRADAHAGGFEIAPETQRDGSWSIALLAPERVARDGNTGLYGFVTPQTPPGDDSYFTFDAVAYDAAIGPPRVCIGTVRSNAGTPCPNGDECSGDAQCLAAATCIGGEHAGAACPLGDECGNGFCVAPDAAPKLHVYVCTAPTPTATPAVTTIAATSTASPTLTATATAPPPSATAVPPSATASATAPASVTPSVAAPSPTAAVAPCAGDCDGDGAVTIAELIVGVSVALGRQPLADCEPFDASGDGAVGVDELIAAVGRALHGCTGPRRAP